MQHLNLLHSVEFGLNAFFLQILGILPVLSAIFIIASKNPVVSVLHLIGLFTLIALYLIFIGLTYLGLSYLLVYVGAVSILFLFILMLINIRVSELVAETNNNVLLAIFVLLLFLRPINNILPSDSDASYNNEILQSSHTLISHISSNHWDSNIVDVTDITSIGNIMYTSHFIWLIITSMILLLAMVGSILITNKHKEV